MLRRVAAALAILALAAAPAEAASAKLDVDYLRSHAHSLAGLGRLPDELGKDIAPYRVLLVGEIHGTREAPRLAFELARSALRNGHPAWIGVEMPVAEQPALDRFRQTGDVGILRGMPFFNRLAPYQDGRSSRAIADMLVSIQKQPAITVFAVDPGVATSAQERDTGMAREIARIANEHRDTVGVCLVGNVHSSMRLGTSWDASYRPMGYELVHGLLPPADVLSIELMCQTGTAWTMQKPQGTGIHPIGVDSSLFANALLWGAYFSLLPDLSPGYGAVLFWRSLTASPPFVTPPLAPLVPLHPATAAASPAHP